MSVVLALVGLVLLLLQVLLIARAVVDWTAVLAGPSTRGSVRSRLSAGVWAATEPILAPVRRVIPPLRIGGTAIDLSYVVVFLAIVLLRRLIA
jgi:YggT family protein